MKKNVLIKVRSAIRLVPFGCHTVDGAVCEVVGTTCSMLSGRDARAKGFNHIDQPSVFGA